MTAARHVHPGQLKMFMSANEIMSQYQPLDADRHTPEDWGTHGLNITRSPGSENPTYRTGPGHNTARTTGGSKLYHRPEAPETDEQLWDRKAEEAGDYGLYDEILEEGVKKPVSLGTQFGSSGKPQVVGGHHRIAVMAQESPDELMPVIHVEGGLHQARMEGQNAERGRGGWRYT